jgi:hypothetical protein
MNVTNTGVPWDCDQGLSGTANARLANMEVFPGISMGPDVRFGKPCLTGTRIDVATIVGGPRGW